MTLLLISPHSRLSGFRYLWLKKAVYCNSRVHCIESIIGRRDLVVNAKLPSGIATPIEGATEGAMFYLCGVSYPYVHANNLHLALRAKGGAECEVRTYLGETIRVKGAERVEFDDRAARALFPGLDESFLSCRNFQFAVQHLPERFGII